MHDHFSRTYQRARDHFLSLCDTTQASLEHIKHPLQGPDGDLYLDVALWGPIECDHMLFITSATHGIEGYAGSGLQCLLLDEGLSQRLPPGTSLLMIHGVNPHGFAWQRRVTEDNVDLNRNFIDHRSPPANDDYAEIAELLEPRTWNAEVEADIAKQMAALSKTKGARWLQGAMTKGQYTHPSGFFYGGRAPAWSNLQLHDVASRYVDPAKMSTMVDIHTALGEFGTAECITTYPQDSSECARCQALWGSRVRSTNAGSSLSVDVNGPMVDSLQGYSDFLGTGLEFGTQSIAEVTMALIGDQWLHSHGQFDMQVGHPAKDRMMEAFYPDSEQWREAIADITREIISQCLLRTDR